MALTDVLDMSVEALHAPREVAPPSDPWLERRTHGFGASEIGALYLVLGLRAPAPGDPKYLLDAAQRLIAVKAGKRKPAGGSRATEGGQRRERDVLRAWVDAGCIGTECQPWTVQHADVIPREYLPLVDRHCPRLTCTPDGFAFDAADRLCHVEIKTTWRKHDERHDGAIWWCYRLQVLAGMAVTAAHSGALVIGLGYASDNDGQLAVYPVERDEDEIGRIRAACVEGWKRVEALKGGV